MNHTPLPAPTLLDSWKQLKSRLHRLMHLPQHSQALEELREWFWEGACAELSEQHSDILRSDHTARANFEALATIDMDCGEGQSVLGLMLGLGGLSEQEIRLLKEVDGAPLRLVQVIAVDPDGLQTVVDQHTDEVMHVGRESWQPEIEIGTSYMARIAKFPGVSVWAGPCLSLPSDPANPLRMEAEEGLRALRRSPGRGTRAERESFLVDLSHLWAHHLVQDQSQSAKPTPLFTLLRGA
ncbi:MAG: hypothetical protein P1V35_14445 [Planctomycetota bacterium]|nr:hypothetical protein [Planctomycetota bacterium]